MARSVAWRRTVSDAVSWRQDQSQNATIYILRETGPTGFLLKEEGESKKYKVFLGDPHSCTCQVFTKEKDLCKHICWVLLKKFRISRDNALSFQLGLVEREINEILRGLNQNEQRPSRRTVQLAKNAATDHTGGTGDRRETLPQKVITEDEVCPICQDGLLEKREPVTYCRYGCGQSTHIRCMKVWAEHQKSTGQVVIRCPLCREDFGQLEHLQAEYRTATLQKTRTERREDIHMGVMCKGCNQSPLSGKCYRCTHCFDYCLCHPCFTTNIHQVHSFQFRQKPTQRWRPAQRGSGTALPQAVVEELQNRDISDSDYDLLLQLDNDAANKPSNIPEKVIRSFPTETLRQNSAMLTPGTQCRVCLRGYEVGQVVRRLPCRHKYHISCIDQWLLHEHPTCPVDGIVVWNPLTADTSQQRCKQRPQSLERQKQSVKRTPEADQQGLTAMFALTGLGISRVNYEQIGSRHSSAMNRTSSSGRGEIVTRPPRRDSPASTRHQRKTINRRTSASDDSLGNNVLAVTGAITSGFERQRVLLEPGAQDMVEAGVPHGRTESDPVGKRLNIATVCRNNHTSSNILNSELNSNDTNSHSAIHGGTDDSLSNVLEGLTIGSTHVASAVRAGATAVARPGWRPPQSVIANERSHISSIPLPREAVITPLGNRQQSSGTPPVAEKKPPIPDGALTRLGGHVLERGRTNSRRGAPRRGSRSLSTGRARSGEKMNAESPSRFESLDNMYLGSPTGNLLKSRTLPGSPINNNRGHRSNHPRPRTKLDSFGDDSSSITGRLSMDIALSGSRLTAPTP